mmetsp:Transcript_1426/g.3532  ORF Transcript_1426/g.3532 Transcript_1426/m.3532 type:complete len:276 (-) Transcript_1426:1169-1996(-)
MTCLQESGDTPLVLVMQIGTLFDQHEGKFLILDGNRVHQHIVRFPIVINIDRLGVGARSDQFDRHVSVIGLDSQNQGRAFFIVHNIHVGTRSYQHLDDLQVPTLGRNVKGRDTVDMIIRIFDTAIFNHFLESLHIVWSGPSNGIYIGTQIYQLFGAILVSSRGRKHDGGPSRIARHVDMVREFLGVLILSKIIQHNVLGSWVALGGNRHEGRDAIQIHKVIGGTGLQQQFHGFRFTTGGGFQQCCSSVVMQYTDIGTMGQENLHNVHMTSRGGVH